MDEQQPPPGKGYIIVRDDQLDEEGMRNLMAFVELLLKIDAELAAKGQSPIQHIHDKHAREVAEQKAAEASAKPKRRCQRILPDKA